MARNTNVRSHRRRGATIIENLIAAVIMGIALVGVVSMYGFVTTTTRNNDRIAMAYNLGRSATEEIRLQGFAYAPEGASTAYYDVDGNLIPPADLQTVNPSFSVTKLVTTTNAVYRTHVQSGQQTLIGGTREVTVTVEFMDAEGEEDFVIKTLLTESGS